MPLPPADLATAERWATLAERIGRKTCHGSAHDPDESQWAVSGKADAEAVLDALERPEGQLGTVLDWGAGAGRVASWVAWWAEAVILADASSLVIGAAELDNMTAVVTDDPASAAEPKSLDAIYSLHVAYCLTPEGLRKTIEQLGLLLKVGGKLVMDIPWWHDADPYHRDPDPDGLPGGWWIHTGQTMMNGITSLWLRKAPPALYYGHGAAPRWSDLTELRLWVWEKQP